MNEQHELVSAAHPEVHKLLGVVDSADPTQAARRLVPLVPHLRLSARRIRFHLPTLREWVAAQAAQKGEMGNQDNSLAAA